MRGEGIGFFGDQPAASPPLASKHTSVLKVTGPGRVVKIASYHIYVQGRIPTEGTFYPNGSRLDHSRAWACIAAGRTRILSRVLG